jgi:hypothetical protein
MLNYPEIRHFKVIAMNSSCIPPGHVAQSSDHSPAIHDGMSASLQLLMHIDELQRSIPMPLNAEQIASMISEELDQHPRIEMKVTTSNLAGRLGISPRRVSIIARSIGFKVVAVRDGQRVFKTLQRGNPVQRRAFQR